MCWLIFIQFVRFNLMMIPFRTLLLLTYFQTQIPSVESEEGRLVIFVA